MEKSKFSITTFVCDFDIIDKGHAHGGHYGSKKYHSHGHDHGHSHGHGNGNSHGHGHGVSHYSNYKKYDRFSYGGKGKLSSL